MNRPFLPESRTIVNGYLPVKGEHDDDTVNRLRGRHGRDADIATVSGIRIEQGATGGLSSLCTADNRPYCAKVKYGTKKGSLLRSAYGPSG